MTDYVDGIDAFYSYEKNIDKDLLYAISFSIKVNRSLPKEK
ncbi:MAG: hypothetical protein ACI9BD_001164 [Candidatus Marinamargulisbacteria bacterium]